MVLAVNPNYLSQGPCLALCDLHHPETHGVCASSSRDVHTHILVLDLVDANVRSINDALSAQNSAPEAARTRHPSVRAFSRVARSSRIFGVQVVRHMQLPGGELVALVRTGGLRRLQRACRARIALTSFRV